MKFLLHKKNGFCVLKHYNTFLFASVKLDSIAFLWYENIFLLEVVQFKHLCVCFLWTNYVTPPRTVTSSQNNGRPS